MKCYYRESGEWISGRVAGPVKLDKTSIFFVATDETTRNLSVYYPTVEFNAFGLRVHGLQRMPVAGVTTYVPVSVEVVFDKPAAALQPTIPLEVELRDAWIGEGNSKKITFLRWCKEMAENPRGTLQAAAIKFLAERKAKK